MKLKVAIAGYGVVGKRRRKYIDLHPDMETVAVCDISYQKSGIFEDGVRFHSNYKQLLAEDFDVLMVCLPNYLAPEVTIAGLEKNCHVFCEKPPGRTVKDIAMVREVEKKHPKLKLMFGFNHRYHDSVQKTYELIKSGKFGRVINLRGVYGKSKIISFQSDWRTKRDMAGGGILLDQGIHMVDLIILFGGEFT